MWRNIGWALGVVLFLFSGAALAQRARDAFEQKLEAELTALDPGAVPLLQQANAARARDDHRTAERLYGELFARVPAFIHAERRRCVELNRLGDRQAALPLCQDAVNKDASSENLGALGATLIELPNDATPSGAASPHPTTATQRPPTASDGWSRSRARPCRAQSRVRPRGAFSAIAPPRSES